MRLSELAGFRCCCFSPEGHSPISRVFSMPSLASIVSSKSKSSGTLAVVPLVIASAAIAGYARSTASHHHMEAAKDKEEQHKHDEEVFHQHIAYPWKGTR